MYKVGDKLMVQGVEALSDVELLTVLLDDDQAAATVAENILENYSRSLASIAAEQLPRLRMIEGVGIKRAQRLIAAAEWGRRCVVAESMEQKIITNSGDIVSMFRPMFDSIKHEECWALYLNSSNRVVEQQRMSQGGIATTVVDHRIIVKRALELLATNIILVHNHPSGDATPSDDDIGFTHKVKSAANLFDITLLDHIIITSNHQYSFKSAGAL